MKLIFKCVLIGLLLVSDTYVQAQSAKTTKDSTTAADSAKTVKATLFKMDTILSLLRSQKEDKKEKVGVIQFDNTRPVTVYIATAGVKKRTGRKVFIDSLTLVMKDGYISDAQLFSGHKKFTNELAPIPLTSKRFSQTDFLQNSTNENEFIVFQEALSFISYNSFFADDGLIVLTPGSNTNYKILEKNVGVNSVLDVRLYTDALGVLGQTPNGIVQTDVRFKQYLHRKNIKNRGVFLGQYVKLNFNASKFDSKKNYQDSSGFSRTGLMQKAYLTGEFSYNLLNDWIEKKSLSSFYWDIGAGFSSSTLARSRDTVSVTMNHLFTEFGLNLRSSSNIGLDVYGRAIVQYSPQTDFNGQNKDFWFLRFGGEVYWNPFGDQANRLFARMNYIFSSRLEEKKSHYAQVQIGYSVILSKLAAKN